MSDERLDTKTREFLEARMAADLADKEAKRLKRRRDQIEAELFSLLEGLKQKSATLDDGTRVTRVETRYHEVLSKQALAEALEEMGLIDEMTFGEFRKKSLNEYVRREQDAGNPLPPGLGVRYKRYIQVAKPRRRV